ncbi:MAG: hypothetical protein ACRDRJ_15075 [Streptosporangiaceae bacterium]
MTGQPVLGDFLTAARRNLERAGTSVATSAPGRDADEIIASFHRLIMALAGHADDLTTAFGRLPDPDLEVISPFARAAYEARDALRGAAAALGHPERVGPLACVLARRMDAAAASLTVGRDLLQTHSITDPDGSRLGRSSWATVITSPMVTRALLAELTATCRQAADVGAAVLPTIAPPAEARTRRVHLACQWLALAGAAGEPAYRREPVTKAERDLLYAVPDSALPARRAPGGGLPVPGLCQALVASCQRVSHLAWAAASAAPGSPAISATSWRRIATTSTATSHHCNLLLTALAARADHHHSRGAESMSDALIRTASWARLSRTAWLRAARELSDVTTDVRWQTSRTADEAADLAIWTGRLAFVRPNWIPSDGPRYPTRPPEELVPDSRDLSEAVTAVHYCSEALARLAVCNEEQVRGAVSIDRVLVSARDFPDGSDNLDRFAPAPEARITSLLEACREATKTSNVTVSRIAGIARQIEARSQILGTARVVTRPALRTALRRSAATVTVGELDEAMPDPSALPGSVETRVRELGVTSPRLLWRASGIDRLARQVINEATETQSGRGQPRADGRARKRGTGARGGVPVVGRERSSRGQARAHEPELEAEP